MLFYREQNDLLIFEASMKLTYKNSKTAVGLICNRTWYGT